LGPSLWIKNDRYPILKKEFRDFSNPTCDPAYPKAAYENLYKNGFNIGYNLSSELDIRISKKASLIANMDFFKIKKVDLNYYFDEFNPSLGFKLLYFLK
jgi:hypothetical protein